MDRSGPPTLGDTRLQPAVASPASERLVHVDVRLSPAVPLERFDHRWSFHGGPARRPEVQVVGLQEAVRDLLVVLAQVRAVPHRLSAGKAQRPRHSAIGPECTPQDYKGEVWGQASAAVYAPSNLPLLEAGAGSSGGEGEGRNWR
jgi:hypothetical protein